MLMRWRDLLTVIGLALAIAGGLAVERARGREQAEINRAAAELNRLSLEISYRSVTGQGVERNEFGWPTTVNPDWFEKGDAPRNSLADPDAPWIEIAGPEDRTLDHPRIRMLVNDRVAGFWYNPGTGVVRARVPVMVSDDAALELYNRLNASELASIFDSVGDRLTRSSTRSRH
jgi:hypothetical protein